MSMELAFFGAALILSLVMACIFVPILRKAMREHADHEAKPLPRSTAADSSELGDRP